MPIASDQSPALTSSLSAQLGEGERFALFLGNQLDQGDVADFVEADEHGVVEHAVGQAANHGRPGRLHDVEIGQGIAFLIDDDAGTAAAAAAGIDGDDRRLDLVDDLDAVGFGQP